MCPPPEWASLAWGREWAGYSSCQARSAPKGPEMFCQTKTEAAAKRAAVQMPGVGLPFLTCPRRTESVRLQPALCTAQTKPTWSLGAGPGGLGHLDRDQAASWEGWLPPQGQKAPGVGQGVLLAGFPPRHCQATGGTLKGDFKAPPSGMCALMGWAHILLPQRRSKPPDWAYSAECPCSPPGPPRLMDQAPRD